MHRILLDIYNLCVQGTKWRDCKTRSNCALFKLVCSFVWLGNKMNILKRTLQRMLLRWKKYQICDVFVARI